MVKKIKVVQVENVETPETLEIEAPPPTPEPTPTPEPISDEPPIQEETKIDEVETPKEVKPKKQDEKITCAICNKTMLMKTYKYTHQKLCKPTEPEPPKVAEAKPKVKKEVKSKEEISKPTHPVQVSFTEFKDRQQLQPEPVDIYRAAREHRRQFRVNRVKSLISQAI